MSELPQASTRPSLFTRWARRSERYFQRNGWELRRLGFFIAFPIAVYWTFADNDRVERIYQWLKPHSTQPTEPLESLPEDFFQRYTQGEEVNDILKSHAEQEAVRKERQLRQLEELREQQERYKQLSAKQPVGESKAL